MDPPNTPGKTQTNQEMLIFDRVWDLISGY